MQTHIPFYGNTEDDTHCFQAALRMALKYFFPKKEYTWAELDRITQKSEGMWMWPYATMTWLSQQGFIVRNIELFDTSEFARKGHDYLVTFYGKETADVQKNHTNIAVEQKRANEGLKYVFFEKRIPDFYELEKLMKKGFIIFCSVNSRALNQKSGYVGHTVVVLCITANEIIFHDPGLPHHPHRTVSEEIFEKAWAYPQDSAKNIFALKKRRFFEKSLLFIATLPLLVYQKTLSYDHGPMKVFYPQGYCRFYPSCSEYGIRAIKKYGVVRGYAKAIWRVLRCHPWSAGGVDEP